MFTHIPTRKAGQFISWENRTKKFLQNKINYFCKIFSFDFQWTNLIFLQDFFDEIVNENDTIYEPRTTQINMGILSESQLVNTL